MSQQRCSGGGTYCAAFSMTDEKGVLIRNVYYMLAYAFQVLRQTNYERIAPEDFTHVQDLFAAILSTGIAQQLKRGLYREYVPKAEDLVAMRGKLDVDGTIRNKLQRKQILYCQYDEMSENNVFNRILKTTAMVLLRQQTVKQGRKDALKKVMLFLDDVDVIEPSRIPWNKIRYHRNNQTTAMLLNICRFVLQGLLLSRQKGEYRMAAFLDEPRMAALYQRFVLEYFKYHHPHLKAAASQIPWNTDDGVTEFLPVMQTDITLKYGERILIIDTKYYGQTMQVREQYDSRTIHSGNLYQIFAYVKNLDAKNTGRVSGLLLYAKTSESIAPDSDFLIGGNRISVKTLDLNVAFPDIAAQLDRIAASLVRHSQAGFSGGPQRAW